MQGKGLEEVYDMTGNMVSVIGYVIAVAALVVMIAAAAAWNNYKSKKKQAKQL
ncbi:MAG: hypothetical protein LUD18_03435 [Lachnospiraceae bacterium]|nr:hypothetical protein [Lachnospiraceae bacterium]